MERLSLGFILSATGGRLGRESFNIKINRVCTDTRNITPGCLYIALKGDRFDGHDFIEDAFRKGAYAAIAERPSENASRPVILVNSTRAALLSLAQSYRMLFNIPVVGVTGSVGKTSTKETVYSVLSQKFNTHKNEGNLNNEIGMPISVFGLGKKHEAAIFEMGMSAFGEISRLSRVARPDIAIITNIGISHIEKLGTQDNILKAKLEIIDGMQQGGTLILNGDDAYLQKFMGKAAPQNFPMKIMTYGINNKSGVYAQNIIPSEKGTDFEIRFDGGSVKVHMNVPGSHNVYNALAAFCTGLKLGVEPEAAAAGLGKYEPTGLRQKISAANDVTFIEDCYNASPDSMRAAFDVMNTVRKGGRSVAVLADMLELGASSQKAHTDVGELAAACGVDVLLCYGKDAKFYIDGYHAGHGGMACHFDDQNSLAAALLDILRTGDTVLFKGSRGMQLEETVKRAYEGWKNR